MVAHLIGALRATWAPPAEPSGAAPDAPPDAAPAAAPGAEPAAPAAPVAPPGADELGPWGFALTWGLCCLILLLRLPEALLAPALRGEDGLFFAHQREHGFLGAALLPYQGYLHLWPRLLAWLGDLLPAPPGLTVSGVPPWLLAGLACAWITRRELAFLAPDRARFALAVWLAAQPMAINVVGAASTGQFFLLWIGYLLLISPLPASRAGRAGLVGGQLLIGLTAVGSIALLPLWLLRAALRPEQRALSLACALGPALELLLLDWSTILDRSGGAASRLAGPLGVVELLVLRVAGGPLLGEAEGPVPMPPWAVWALGVLATAALVAAAAWVWRSREARLRGWLALTGLCLAAYLAVACGGRPILLRAPTLAAGRFFLLTGGIVALVYAAGLTRAAGGWRRLLGVPLAPAAWAALIAFHLTY